MLKFFHEGNKDSSNTDLPWVNEYLDYNPEAKGKVFEVQELILSAKGMIVITKFFKGFIWKDQSVHEHFKEAMQAWKNGMSDVPGIFCLAEDKIELAFDEEVLDVKVQSDGRIARLNWGKQDLQQEVSTSNPFLLMKEPPPLLAVTPRTRVNKSTTPSS